MSGCVSKYILDTTQNSVKVPYLKVFKIQSAFKPLKHILNSLFELCNSVSGSIPKMHFKYPILIIFIKQNTL